MLKIKITYDPEGFYTKGRIVTAKQLIDSYNECHDVENVAEWLRTIPESEAVAFIFDAWGLRGDVV